MEGLLALLAIPLITPLVAKRIWHTSINWTEMVISMVLVSAIVAGVWQAGVFSMTSDVEIWNGKITDKQMNDGHYVRSYECNCTTSCSGSGSNQSCTTSCDTCYEDHYTRSYDGYSTVGNWTFDSIDTTWRMTRDAFPPPASYTNCVVGEPASRPHAYTNYVQAVPESLFHDDSTITTYADKVPAQPNVYGFYKFNRVIQVGTNYAHATELNMILNNALRSLGPLKQANIIVILTNIDDPNYRYAVERKWLGGEKNDITLFVGLEGTTIKWVDVMTWALNKGNEMFHVKLRDAVKALGTIDDVNALSNVVVTTTKNLYDRPHMKDFEYLEEDIQPADWVIILAVILALGGSIGMTILFHYKEVDDVIGGFFKNHRKTRRPFR